MRCERGSIAPRRAAKTWILTGSLENFRINVERGFDLIGFKERRRLQAEEFEPGDEIVFYVTGVQAFGGIARVTSEMFEDTTPIWPQRTQEEGAGALSLAGRGRARRGPAPRTDFVPAEELVGELEHVAKWPLEHWHLAFQGQLRTIGEADASLLRERLGGPRPRRPR